MAYRVIDPKGVAYSDDNGRQVLACGARLDDILVAKNFFTEAGIKALIADGRIEPEGKSAKGPIEPPANKKAPEAEGKRGGKRK
jgi:hypothetical protein